MPLQNAAFSLVKSRLAMDHLVCWLFVCLFVCYHAENGLIHCFDDIDNDGHLKWYHCGVHEVVQPGGEVLVQSHREDQVPGSQDCNLIILFTNNLDLDVMFRPFMP